MVWYREAVFSRIFFERSLRSIGQKYPCSVEEAEAIWNFNLQSNLNGSNIFGTMEIRSRHV